MSKKEKIAFHLKYRFSEFVENGPPLFENANLLFKQVNNRNHRADLPILAISQEYGAIPRDKIDYTVSVSAKSLESYKVVEKGDFIISLRSFQGGIEYSVYHGICSPAYIILRKRVDIEERYYKYYFKSYRFIQDLKKDLEGIRDGKMVSYRQFSTILLPRPDKKEQQKVADCLSFLDKWIAAEDKKLSTLKDYKKGLMQKLFPAAGKTIPEWRFPEFRDCGEWETAYVSKLVSVITPPKKIPSSEYQANGKFPIIDQGQDLICGWTNDAGTVVKFEQKLLIFGDHTCIIKLIDRPFAQGADGIKILSAKKRISVEFLFHYLSFHPIKSDSYKRHFSELKETLVLFPNIESGEQQKIAACFSTLDEWITAQAQKTQALRNHKRGLVQGLFPLLRR